MATLTIRNLDETLKSRLRLRAASRNRSMEEEARQILRSALNETRLPADEDLGSRIRARFSSFGDVRLAIEPREPVRERAVLDDSIRKTASPSPKPRSIRR